MAKTAILKASLKKLKDKFNLLSDEPMKNHTSIKIGGPADLFAMPETKDEFINLIKAAHRENIDLTIIGDGTNLLVKDKGIRGLVITTTRLKQEIKKTNIDSDNILVTASSGTKLAALCNFCLKNSLQGLEFAAGIPGTVGGAVTMNAGTPTGSMSQIVESIKILTDNGEISELKKNDLKFSYRTLNNNHNGIVIEVSLLLRSGEPSQIKALYTKNLNNKKLTQPISKKSAGCIFKNPANSKPAGKLIDMAGLKGKKIGDAIVSESHANFILNLGQATCDDVLNLKKLIENKVSELYSVALQTEIIIKGE